jgi:hypothetical protein
MASRVKASLIPYLISNLLSRCLLFLTCISIYIKGRMGIRNRRVGGFIFAIPSRIPVCCVKVPSFESIKFQVYFCRDRLISRKKLRPKFVFFCRKAEQHRVFSFHPPKISDDCLFFPYGIPGIILRWYLSLCSLIVHQQR